MIKNFLLCLITLSFSYTQGQSLSVGKVKLTLGSDKISVLDLLDAAYYVEEDYKNENLFSIWDSEKKNYNYGDIKFGQSNQLTSITKNWSTTVNDSHSQIFEQLIKLLDGYKKDGAIKIETEEIFEPNYKASTLSFIQDKKVIEISIAGNRIIMRELLKESD
jgi:hypothetical protein